MEGFLRQYVGGGSQFDSLSAPGDSFSVSEPCPALLA
jgi:hypothetical protein